MRERVTDLLTYARDRGAFGEPDACWMWTGALDRRTNYGTVQLTVYRGRAHRMVYELLVGPIPASLQLDHQCHNRDQSCAAGSACLHRRCVNPAHLEPATNEENQPTPDRRRGWPDVWRAKTHCPQGHPYSGSNLVWRTSHGGPARYCRLCLRRHSNAYKARQRAKH